MPHNLAGLRVLVIEDEGPVAMLVEAYIEDLGCTVAASAASVDQATDAIASTAFDVALLDVNVAGERIHPVARMLVDRSIPFGFLTGYGRDGLPEGFGDRPVAAKPFLLCDVERLLQEIVAPDR